MLPTLATAEESVLNLVDECDLLAAHPEDPERYAEGVADDNIVPTLAILACQKAIKSSPNSPRFTFQLGRALLAKDKKKAALEKFQKSAKAGYAAAYGYLGDAYQFGHGVKTDTRLAYQNYKKAVELGFTIAKGQLEQLNFDPSIFAIPYLHQLFLSKLEQIHSASSNPSTRAIVRNYMFNLTQYFMQNCGNIIRPQNISGLYKYRYPSEWKAEEDEKIGIAVQTAIGEFDGKIFVDRYGCEGPVAKHIFININKFYANYL